MKKGLTFLSIILIILMPINFSTSKVEASSLVNKTIIYFGDSITDGTANGMISWDYYINELEALKHPVNAGVSGATFSTSRKDNMIMAQVLKYKNKNYDYVLIQGGINDAMEETPLGHMTTSYDINDFDTDTFIGSVDATLYYLTKYYNRASIGTIITYPTPTAKDYGWRGKTSEAKEYFDALKAVCDKWEISYIDFFEGELSTVIGKDELIDGLHLNDQGYQKISPYLLDFIKELTPYNRNLKREQGIRNSGLKYYHLRA